jgi:MFS family permease
MHIDVGLVFSEVKHDLHDIPSNVKRFLVAVFFFFMALGAISPYMSIFIYSIVDDYAIVGSIFALFFLGTTLTVMLLGPLADRVSKPFATAVIYALYPLAALAYFLAGVVRGAVGLAMIVVARFFNGVFASHLLFVESYLRENSPKGHTSGVFGLYFTTRFLGIVTGALLSMSFVFIMGLTVENINLVFWLMIPCVIIASLLAVRVPPKTKHTHHSLSELAHMVGMRKVEQEVKDFEHLGHKALLVLLFGITTNALSALILVFLPLLARRVDFGLPSVGLIFVAFYTPYLLAFFLSVIPDIIVKERAIALALTIAAAVLLWMGLLAEHSSLFFVASFILGLSLAMLRPAINGLLTDLTPHFKEGEITAVYRSVAGVSRFAAALVLGVAAQLAGLGYIFLLASVFCLSVALAALLPYKRKPLKHLVVK